MITVQAVPSLRGGGGQGAFSPLTSACAPHFGSLKILFVFVTLGNDKKTDNDGKRNNYVQTLLS